nr:MAG TPA: hypothetical protein [Caudoviricetes sp.]
MISDRLISNWSATSSILESCFSVKRICTGVVYGLFLSIGRIEKKYFVMNCITSKYEYVVLNTTEIY